MRVRKFLKQTFYFTGSHRLTKVLQVSNFFSCNHGVKSFARVVKRFSGRNFFISASSDVVTCQIKGYNFCNYFYFTCNHGFKHRLEKKLTRTRIRRADAQGAKRGDAENVLVVRPRLYGVIAAVRIRLRATQGVPHHRIHFRTQLHGHLPRLRNSCYTTCSQGSQ